MNKTALVKKILPSSYSKNSQNLGKAFAPTNIALCKYWGKRDDVLNLPTTASLSISLGEKGSQCSIRETQKQDGVIVNQNKLELHHEFSQKISTYLDLFRPTSETFYEIEFNFNIPIAAGVASSACSFASLVMALEDLYGWKVQKSSLSILARLGSGSACRSIWQGFVKWQMGDFWDGTDSYGIPLNETWPELCVGLHILTQDKKPLSSRNAMERTVKTSAFYPIWPQQASKDLSLIEEAILSKDFEKLGSISESNALTLHAMLMNSFPPIIYSLPETLKSIHAIWELRESGHPVFFTQDAGANLKLLFLEKDKAQVQAAFPQIEVIQPFKLIDHQTV